MSDSKKAGNKTTGKEVTGAEQLTPELEAAKQSLAKLPIVGPAVWLYARDPRKKFTFMADVDVLLMPPVILDQCRLYSRDGVPFSFFTWAKVSDEIDKRLRTGEPKIAPHEWQSGNHVWMVDMVAPFGHFDEMFKELRETELKGLNISALVPNADGGFDLKEWEAL